MLYKTIILSLGLLSLINCKTQNEAKLSTKNQMEQSGDSSKSTKDGSIIYFNEGENRFLDDYQMNVTFKNISEDSRCPKGVNCIWVGVAVAQLEVMGTTTRPVTLSLASLDNKGRNYQKSADFNGYKITLAEITPYPESTQGQKALKGKYRIGITIQKSYEVPTTR